MRMCHGLYRCLLFVLACILVPGSRADLDNIQRRRPAKVDCQRYVFAPQCRGVSAKRGHIQITDANQVIPEPEVLDNVFLKNAGSVLRNQDSARNWQPLESLQFPSLQNDLPPWDPRRRQASARYDDELFQDNRVFP